jgi:hypothetical protein
MRAEFDLLDGMSSTVVTSVSAKDVAYRTGRGGALRSNGSVHDGSTDVTL